MSSTRLNNHPLVSSEGRDATGVVSEIEELGLKAEDQTAEEVLGWATEKYFPRIALASSFSAEDVVVIDIISRLGRKPGIFALDTGRLHQETYDVIDAVRDRYQDLEIGFYFPKAEDAERMLATDGPNLFYSSLEKRKLCCTVRKVEPLKRALSTLDAWVTGLRREQAVSRTELAKVEVDEANGSIVKINPLADWSSDDVWRYVRENDLPYNSLYDQGFTSIGCAPCTRPTRPGLGSRSGRWWWEDPATKECGLHHR
jgi:phosphoadenosine phosphosulfate reductase